MKRPDAEMIKMIQKERLVSREKLKEFCNLPYFYMSYKPMDDFDFASENDLPVHEVFEERNDGSVLIRQCGEPAEFVYNDFILSCRSSICRYSEKSEASYWGWVYRQGGTNLNEIDPYDWVFLVIRYPGTKNTWFVWKGAAGIVEETGQGGEKVIKYQVRTASDYEEKMRLWHKKALEENRLPQCHSSFEMFVRPLTNQAGTYYLFVHKLMKHIKYGDKHAVEVTPTPDRLAKAKRNPVNRKRPWAKSSGPNILLLDRMPTEKTKSTGTHASPKPHRRRGHWKTLRHPRYRHHPQYQKKIYCKPSFVGPRQATYEGNIYRLVQPLEEAI